MPALSEDKIGNLRAQGPGTEPAIEQFSECSYRLCFYFLLPSHSSSPDTEFDKSL